MQRNALSSGLLIAGLFLPSAAAQGPVGLEKRLARRWEKAATELRVPGFAIAVIRDGKTVLRKTFGIRDCAGDKPVTDATAFYIASCTKSFVATGIMVLAEAGQLSLDDPVRKHLPRLRLADARATQELTVRDLLCHAKGINSGPIVFLDAYTGEITEDRYYRFLREVQPLGEPTYTNVHFTLAGRVIEAVSKQPWREFLAKRVFQPLGLRDTTGYADAMYERANVAIPMRPEGDGFAPASVRKADATMHAAGGLGASLRDLERWARFQLGDDSVPRLLKPATLREMHRMHAKLPKPRGRMPRRDGFGLGWFCGEFRGKRYLEHGGGYIGAAALVSFLPEEKLAVVCLANASGSGQGLLQLMTIEAYDALLGHEGRDLLSMVVRQVRQFEKRAASTGPKGKNPAAERGALTLPPASYVGAFHHADFGTVRFRIDSGDLVVTMGALRGSLHTTGKDSFVADMGTGVPSAGRFVLAAGRCQAVTVDVGGKTGVKFVRR